MTEYQDAFISYGRADSKAFAFKLYDRLRQEGLNIWFDFADIPLGVLKSEMRKAVGGNGLR